MAGPKVLPEFKLVPEPLSPQAAELLERPPSVWSQLGERHRIGGEATLRNAQWPKCPWCGEAMSFYAQLDGLPKPSEFDLADAGLIFVFICFDCFQTAAVLDSA